MNPLADPTDYWSHEQTVNQSFLWMSQAKTTPLSDGLVLDEFERTSVNMSTYLLAFIVGNFTPISRNVSDTLVGRTQITDQLVLLTSYSVRLRLDRLRCLCILCLRRRSTRTMLWTQQPNCWSSTMTSLKSTIPSKSWVRRPLPLYLN